MRGSESGGGNQFCKGKEREKGKRENRERRERRRKEERRGRRPMISFSDLRRSDSQNSLDQGVKSVYVTRTTLQEVGIPPTFVYFPL